MYSTQSFTVNALLDTLLYCDLRASSLRIQVDGASDNINYSMFAVASMLVYAGIFEEVVIARLPVGYVTCPMRLTLILILI
jgi:hypothetical protein